MNLRPMSIPKNRGFTLIEVLVVIFIFTALLAMSAFFNITFYKGSSFGVDVDTFTTVLQRARGKAMSNINQLNQGVYIDTTKYVLFQGDSFATRNSAFDQDISRNSNLTFTGPSEVVFGQLSGSSSFQGNIIIKDGPKTATVSLNYEGLIKRQ